MIIEDEIVRFVSRSITYCKEIGMFSLNRAKTSCKWRTAFCNKHCYNKKAYIQYSETMKRCDSSLEYSWDFFVNHPVYAAQGFNTVLSRKRKSVKYFRVCSRGEPFTCEADIFFIFMLATKNPKTNFWVPTRAWRNENLRKKIEAVFAGVPNIYIQASTDPSTPTPPEGWAEMFFGDDTAIKGRAKCPKTYKKLHAVCGTKCKLCFTKDSRVILKKH